MTTPPRWFTVVAVLALLWNLAGCLAIAADLRLSPADVAALDPVNQALYNSRAPWAVAASVVAVLGGLLGSVGLLLRKGWAHILFLLSLVGLIVQDFGLFVVSSAASLMGARAYALQGAVLVIAIGLVALARVGIARRWLR